MNYLDGYVEEVLSEPYYDDYGSGIFRWWVEVSYVCEGTESTTSIFYNNRLIKFVGYQGEYNIGDSIKIVKVK